jgi:hypothetical protein
MMMLFVKMATVQSGFKIQNSEILKSSSEGTTMLHDGPAPLTMEQQ